jgi:uncharacterized membrane protein YbaN (DUF454 family)
MKSIYWKKFFKVIRFTAGILLIILGIIGLFVPILQGILFIVLGGLLLGKDTMFGRWINRQIQRFTKKGRIADSKTKS